MLADPIEQVRTPEIFNSVLPACNIDAVMVPFHVSSDNLENTIRTLFSSKNTAGMILSIPHKTAAAGLVDSISRIAKTANAVNAIRRTSDGVLEGDLFDGVGFLKALERYDMPYINKKILLIGAGGAGAAIAASIASKSPKQISIYDPDEAKSRNLVSSIRSFFNIPCTQQNSNNPSGFDVVINASPLGLYENDKLPLPPELLSAKTIVCDILMKNQPTPLLKAAIDRGNRILPGFDMLILQSPLFFDFFGMDNVAEHLRANDKNIREMLFPSELAWLIDKM